MIATASAAIFKSCESSFQLKTMRIIEEGYPRNLKDVHVISPGSVLLVFN